MKEWIRENLPALWVSLACVALVMMFRASHESHLSRALTVLPGSDQAVEPRLAGDRSVNVVDIANPVEVDRLEELQAQVAFLIETNEQLKSELSQMKRNRESGPGMVAELPEVEGDWVVHPATNLPVKTRTVWHEYRVGQAKILELVRKDGRPIPVGSVIYPQVNFAPVDPASQPRD